MNMSEDRTAASRDCQATSGAWNGLRIVWTIPSLTGGGAEKVLADLASRCAEQGAVTTIITLDRAASADAATDHPATGIPWPVHPAVRVRGLGLQADSVGLIAAVRNNLQRVDALRTALQSEQPHLVVSFLDQMNCLTLLASLGERWPVVISERVHPQFHPLGRVWRLLRRLIYPTCTRLVVQTESIRQYCQRYVRADQLRVIPNGISLPVPSAPLTAEEEQPDEPSRGPVVPEPHLHPVRMVAVGRLSAQKGFDRLLAALAMISQQGQQHWSLDLYGDGPECSQLEQQIRDLGLQDRVQLKGWCPQPFRTEPRYHLLVMTSRYEGFPNVILEAFAHETPVIAFDCPGGPRDLITPGSNGELIPEGDVAGLATAVKAALQNPERLSIQGAQAQRTAANYDADRVWQRWADLIGELVSTGSSADRSQHPPGDVDPSQTEAS